MSRRRHALAGPAVAVLATAALAACASVTPRETGVPPGTATFAPPSAAAAPGPAAVAPEDATDAPIPYACAGGKRFTAAYALDGDSVTVQAGGRRYVLRHAPSASGVRFAAGGVELHGKGDEALLDGAVGAPYRNCRAG